MMSIKKIFDLMPISQRHLLKLVNFYPPMVGAGIHVTSISEDFLTIEVEMKMRFYNRNYVGVHFGGSLYSMCDPFYMFILMEKLGSQYLVWDKAASIQFLRPGKGTVKASFHVPQETLHHIMDMTQDGTKFEPQFHTSIWDKEGQEVAKVEKTLWVRKKSQI